MHPQITNSSKKEVHYFDKNYDKPISWYKQFFPLRFTTNKNTKIEINKKKLHLLKLCCKCFWNIHQFTVGCEAEFTRAAFGRLSCKAKIIDSVPVNNIRLLLSLFYNF
jgi:hypothetical protein